MLYIILKKKLELYFYGQYTPTAIDFRPGGKPLNTPVFRVFNLSE